MTNYVNSKVARKQQLTVFIHAHLQTLFESTGLALIAVRLVDDAMATSGLAPVDQPATDAALEESAASVAGQDSVVFAAATVTTHQTRQARNGVLAADRFIPVAGWSTDCTDRGAIAGLTDRRCGHRGAVVKRLGRRKRNRQRKVEGSAQRKRKRQRPVGAATGQTGVVQRRRWTQIQAGSTQFRTGGTG